MDENVFIRMSIEQRRDYCRRKISEHTPPETPHDEFMIKVYKGLLDLHDDVSEILNEPQVIRTEMSKIDTDPD